MFAFLGKLAQSARQWRAREQAYAELMALDDRALADIGIRRSDIPFVLDGAHDRDVVTAPSHRKAANANGSSRAAA